MTLADLAQQIRMEPRRPDEPAWKRWRRKPGVRAHLRTYKREWRARLRANGRTPT